MNTPIDLQAFRIDGSAPFKLNDLPNAIDPFYESKKAYNKTLKHYRKQIDELQNMMYAHNRYGLLCVFQAMDAAGKDSTIRHVMSGINPHGVEVHAFKKPTDQELDHDFMWRTTRLLPPRGRIGIFNRSYYEEVLVVKVHPVILTKYQLLPQELTTNPDQVWQERYEDIRNLELYAYRNGIRVIKFYLNLSKEEQRLRFLSRLDTPSKNWKFSGGDVEEREHWDKYMEAYEEAINETAKPHAPWYVIPADDKRNMRLMVSQAILNELSNLDMAYPVIDASRKEELESYRKRLDH